LQRGSAALGKVRRIAPLGATGQNASEVLWAMPSPYFKDLGPDEKLMGKHSS